MPAHRSNRYSTRFAAIAIVIAAAAVAFVSGVALGSDEKTVDKVSLTSIAKKPAEFVGKEIRVEGVVTRVLPDDRLFLIADKSACGGCPSKKKCGVFELTVSYDGKLPKSRKTVKITGILTNPEKSRYVFKAASLD